ncbi:hypothetical protein E2C01_073096 [Portunus trituberculatus]|uniref:Uncharacterized protein n=1 Tax=Portunus trituberculatus TaxID=210409 RepID=A0A5B7ID51_PORTR|nr:hypothetical protein [Portunus trituberculatus]
MVHSVPTFRNPFTGVTRVFISHLLISLKAVLFNAPSEPDRYGSLQQKSQYSRSLPSQYLERRYLNIHLPQRTCIVALDTTVNSIHMS